jgi:hypothetical protein
MCTVTIARIPVGADEMLRIACNRDESPTRGAALAPMTRRFGDRIAILPIDPVSEGTWFAVNDAGLVMTTLNKNPVPAMLIPVRSRPSRGTVIPGLLHCGDIDEATEVAFAICQGDFSPFRLILADFDIVREISFVAGDVTIVTRDLSQGPLLFTSSGLGDAVVEEPRRSLFETMVRGAIDLRHGQDTFHGHAWPERRHLSVRMMRDGAATVSTTIIELDRTKASMTYTPLEQGNSGNTISAAIRLRANHLVSTGDDA